MPNSDSTTTIHYQSYLLRLWRENPDSPWRASLESVTTGERQVFARLDALLAFLESGSGQAETPGTIGTNSNPQPSSERR